jgi:hypothetical protein
MPALGMPGARLELTNGERVLTYGSEDQTDVASDAQFASVAETLGVTTVRRAAVHVGGRHLDLDFATLTISARTSGRPPLADLLGVGLPLLWQLTAAERRLLSALGYIGARPTGNAALS